MVKVCDPETMRQSDWDEVLEATSPTGRRKVYAYLFKKQIRRLKTEKSKAAKKEVYEQRRKEFEESNAANEHIHYGLGGTCLFIRFTSSLINRRANYR